MFCWSLFVGVWRFSKGCLEGVLKMSETCLESVWNVSVRCLKGVWKAQIGPVWPNLAMEDIKKCLNVVYIVIGGCLEIAFKKSGR